VPRHASNRGPLLMGGVRRHIAGRVSMDQIVVDLDPSEAESVAGVEKAAEVRAGDYAILFGPGDQGEPTADDWADVVGTISYEMLVRVGARVRRIYLDDSDLDPA
ncbi:MAG: alanine racemase, partial [Pseudonocardiaceae bacterium]